MSLNPNLSQRLQREHCEHLTIESKNWDFILHQNKCSLKNKKEEMFGFRKIKEVKRMEEKDK